MPSTNARRIKDRDSEGDGGFTLIELLMVMVVLPLIIGAVAALLLALLQNTVPRDPHGVATRLSDSHDAQLTSAYFNRDIQGATYASASASPLCQQTGTTGSQLLGLQWATGSQTVDVSYFVESSPIQLVRFYCSSATTPSSYPVTASSASVIADNVFSTLSSVTVGVCPASGFGSNGTLCVTDAGVAYLALTVTCFPSSCPGTLTGALPGMLAHPTSTSGTGLASVAIKAQESNSAYQYSLTAVPRDTNSPLDFTNTNAGVAPPLIVNGTVSGGNCSISVTGAAAVNSTDPGSISDQPVGSISATGGIYTSDPTASSSTSGSLGTVSPAPVYGSPATSPYAGQNAPPGAPPGSGYTVVTETASNWDPSTDPAVVSNGSLNSTLYPNGVIFIVTNGLVISKEFSAPQGVLFYVTGGSASLNGNGTLFLNPLTPTFESPTQPTPYMVLWIDASDSGATLTLGGNGNTTVVNGAIYAPTASTTLKGGGSSGGLTVDALDTGNIVCSGQDSVAVLGSQSGTPPSATTVTPSAASVNANSPITAKIAVQGAGTSTPAGGVSVYECGPAAGAGCGQTTGWAPLSTNQVGTTVTTFTPTGNGGGTATSTAFIPTVAGTYCFAAYYTGTNYTNSADLSSDGCFTVNPVILPVAPIITQPTADGTTYTATTWPRSIDGTATDPGGPGLSNVKLSIRSDQGKYWDGSTFVPGASAIWVDASTSNSWANWKYSIPFAAFSHNRTYTITVESVDSANNVSPTATRTFST